MSERKNDKPMGLPPYYWAKPPATKHTPATRGFVNSQQKKFYLIRVGFALAKIAAAAAVVFLILTRF